MRTSTERALVAAAFVVVSVGAFLLAYLFIGAGPPGARSVPSDVPGGPGAGAAEAAVAPSAAPGRGLPTQPAASHVPWQPGPSALPPSPIGALRLASNTMSDFTVAWDPAVDDSGVRGYRVLMNGFLADTTSSTQATLSWLGNNRPILIQVAAVDLQGNYGPWIALYVIPPSQPAPTATTSTQAPSPTPTPSSTAPSSPAESPSSPGTSSTSASPSAALTPTATATASGPSSASASPSDTASPSPSPSPSASATPGL